MSTYDNPFYHIEAVYSGTAVQTVKSMSDSELTTAHDQITADLAALRDKRDMIKDELSHRKRPAEPTLVNYGGKALVTFTKVHPRSGRKLTYAAVGYIERHQYRANDRQLWSLSGVETAPRAWEAVLDFAGEDAWPTFRTLIEGAPLVTE